MKAHRVMALVGAASCLVLGAVAQAAPVAVTSEEIVSRDHIRDVVDVRDVRTHDDGSLSGIVVNRSDHPVKDVQLVLKYTWLWDREFKPGEDGPGRAVFYTLPQEIPPGGQASFDYRPETPLADRAGGRFMPTVQVAGVTEISRPTMEMGRTAAPAPIEPSTREPSDVYEEPGAAAIR